MHDAAEAQRRRVVDRGRGEVHRVLADPVQRREQPDQRVARLVGAALGGVVVGVGGLPLLALADAVSFLLAAVLIGLLRRRRTSTAGRGAPVLRELADGLGLIRRSRPLQVVVLFFALSGVGEAAMGGLFAPFVHDVLGGSARDYGAVLAVQAIGGIGGGLLLTAIGHRFTPRALFGWGAVAFGALDAALFLYPLLVPRVWPALVIIAVVGVPGAAVFAGVLTVFQTATADASRGRVFGALTAVQNAAMLLSTLVVGGAAQALGIVPVITVQGAVYVLVGVVALIALRRAPLGPGAAPEPVEEDEREAALDNPVNRMRIPSMPLASNVRIRSVTDPVALRAFAHPLRQDLYGLVAREGALTAADAARQLGISHALASHHLRQLAKYGFIEPAETAGNRARPWRVTSTSLEVAPTEPAAHEARDALDRYASERAVQQLADWQQRRPDEDAAWAGPAGVRSGLLYLNPEELRAVIDAWNALLLPLADRRPVGHPADRPADAVPVSVTLVAVPITRTESGG